MKHIATMALMVNLAVAGAYAQQQIPVKLTFSGTGGASPIDLTAIKGSSTQEDVAGLGNLGVFTLRNVRTSTTISQSNAACSGVFFPSSGGGVMRFASGALLKYLAKGGDCIDFVNMVGHCTLTLTITGGTGRFKNATGTLTYTETALAVVGDASNNPVFFTEVGDITGTLSGVGLTDDSREASGQEQPQ
jgi:hypothetical protein